MPGADPGFPERGGHHWKCDWIERSERSVIMLGGSRGEALAGSRGQSPRNRFGLLYFNPLKASRMGHSVKASIWCDSLLISTRFRFLYFRISNCKAHPYFGIFSLICLTHLFLIILKSKPILNILRRMRRKQTYRAYFLTTLLLYWKNKTKTKKTHTHTPTHTHTHTHIYFQ